MADFDDIFGDDDKMDATTAPTLTNVSLDDEMFGEDSSGKVTKRIEANVSSSGEPPHGANWEQINSNEQDEFMSWLDGENSSQTPLTTEVSSYEATVSNFEASPPPAPVPDTTFDSVLLDDNDEFDKMLESGTQVGASISLQDDASVQPTSFQVISANCLLTNDEDDLDRMLNASSAEFIDSSADANSFSLDDDDLDKIAGIASTFSSAAPVSNISLDDDDDDLEQIVQKANKQANAASSRENSSSSLQIKSQVHAQHKPQVDMTAARQAFLETGQLPGGSRLAVWQRAVQPGAADSASMYAVQTTSRSLPKQALLRKEVEALCSRIFSSAAHARILQQVGDSMRGTHLLFIDSAETLFTYLCTQLDMDYFSGMVLTFAPLLLASGSEPLHPEIVQILAATCRRFLPHISKKLPLRSSTTGRRSLLKRMLLYHAPRLAGHLNEHFPTWNYAPPDEYEGESSSGAIPDTWLGSFFEGDAIVSDPANFDFLLKVWDCSLLLEAFSSDEDTPLTTGCFITLYSIITSEKALLRMEGEQLRHCMATTLTMTLLRGEATKNHVFVHGVRGLMNATPPCFCVKLRSSAIPPPPIVEHDAIKAVETPVSAVSSNFGMNTLLSASTQGLKDVSNMMIEMPVKLMIDMPVKLLTMVPLNPMAALSSPPVTSLMDSPETQQLFYLHVQAMEVAAVSMMLEAGEVIPSMFGGIQGHDVPAATCLRYFIVDCRGSDDMRGGQVPTAFPFDPDTVADVNVLDQVLSTLGPLKNAGVHICVMGHGYAHIAEELRQFQETQGVASASPFSLSESFLETYANDQSRVQSTIEFLLKHEFPRVSVLEGGYSAAHGYLFRSRCLTVDDLADHDTPNCKLCKHNRSMQNSHSSLLIAEEKKEYHSENDSDFLRTASNRTSESSHRSVDEPGFSDINLSPATNKSPAAGSYYSSFAGAFKSGSKTILSPTMDGTKWLLKKSAATTAEFANAAVNMGHMGTKTRTGSITGASAVKIPGTPPMKDSKATMPNLNKLRNSLAAIGSESLDMLKKVESAMEHAVEQAAVATTTTAKVRVPFPSTSSQDGGASTSPTKPVVNTSNTASTPPAPRGALSADPAHSKFFHQSNDEMFTIDDDDDEEGQFVQDLDGAERRTSFARDSPLASNDAVDTAHEVIKGHVGALKKGMTVSRAQMQPCVSSPFFACYKKKIASGTAVSRSGMHWRRIVVMENNLVVLQSATRNEDDMFIVKSCHPLSHITRMTCLKKNALMVSIYYKWKADDGQIVERRNSYEVQQRDDFIKAVKTTMDKM